MLNDEQKAKVQEWIAAGLKLSEIQDRLGKECDLRLSYMDLRLLVDDLKLTPKDPVQPEPAKPLKRRPRRASAPASQPPRMFPLTIRSLRAASAEASRWRSTKSPAPGRW